MKITSEYADHVERVLRERIATHELPPGAKLKEMDLADEFNISRPRVRQILTALAGRGLVEKMPNHGVTVARLNAKDLYDLFDLFEFLESLGARLACLNSKPKHWAELVALFGAPMDEALEKQDIEAIFQAVHAYRREVIKRANNPHLTDSLDRIYDRTQMLIRRLLLLPGRAPLSVREHRKILDAMINSDADAAEKMKRKNFQTARSFLEKYQEFLL
uniref:GntR family transcriptional regulator n=1 Tax=Bosea sp. NBC_00436 TaxID=2969620 RepID=A0A9E8A252_9HYPH